MRRNLLRKEEDNDPMSVVSNLFDVAMVFAVALMVALVSRYKYDGDVQPGRFYDGEEPRKRKYGNHYQGR